MVPMASAMALKISRRTFPVLLNSRRVLSVVPVSYTHLNHKPAYTEAIERNGYKRKGGTAA